MNDENLEYPSELAPEEDPGLSDVEPVPETTPEPTPEEIDPEIGLLPEFPLETTPEPTPEPTPEIPGSSMPDFDYPIDYFGPPLDADGNPIETNPEPEPEPDPVPEEPQEPVISVGDLLDLLQDADTTSDPVEEVPAEEAVAPYDVVAVELDPATLAILGALNDVKGELILISDQVADIQLQLDDNRPMLTTSFKDYTVSEGLLLLLLLSAFLAACYKLLRGGFQWLRS